MFVEAIMSDVN